MKYSRNAGKHIFSQPAKNHASLTKALFPSQALHLVIFLLRGSLTPSSEHRVTGSALIYGRPKQLIGNPSFAVSALLPLKKDEDNRENYYSSPFTKSYPCRTKL